jgi:hypothetical protein
VFLDDGEVISDSTWEFLSAYMAEFRTFIGMVLTAYLAGRSEARRLIPSDQIGSVA